MRQQAAARRSHRVNAADKGYPRALCFCGKQMSFLVKEYSRG
jgi:hypothetical protein